MRAATTTMSHSVFKDFAALVKFRLSASVVATSGFGYGLAVKYYHVDSPNWSNMLWLLLGGFLVVASSNTFNQLIEKKTDAKMDRTFSRPIVTERINRNEAITFGLICGVSGLFILYYFLNPLTALLSFLAWASYVLMYTPLKKITPFAVFIGAFPGAIPPLSGWVAVYPEINMEGVSLFLVQFFWQFPHFWAIAWLLHDDYNKAGYLMLPTYEGRGKKSGYFIVIYSVVLLLISIIPAFLGITSLWILSIVVPFGLLLIYYSVILTIKLDVKSAKKLMFASLIYTPAVFTGYLLL